MLHLDRVALASTAVVSALFMLTLGAPSATADVAHYSITVGNSDIDSSAGPYATVDVVRTSNTFATITFNAEPGFRIGDSGKKNEGIGVNVNGSWTASSWTPGTYTNGGATFLASMGSFNQTFYQKGGFSTSVTTFSFDVTASGATEWQTASDVLVAQSHGTDGNFAVGAHVFVCADAPCTSASKTGYAGGNIVPVPDGGVTVMLLGGALVGLEAVRRMIRA